MNLAVTVLAVFSDREDLAAAGPQPRLIPMPRRPMAEAFRLLVPSLRFEVSFNQPGLDLPLVLFVADSFLPIDGFAVELFLYGDVGHGRVGCGAMPMLLTRRTPDHVAWPNFLFRAALALYPPAPDGDNQGLPERMGMPGRPGAGLERDARAHRARRVGGLNQRVDTYGAGEVFRGPFAGGVGTTAFDVHDQTPEC